MWPSKSIPVNRETRISSEEDLNNALYNLNPGDSVTVIIYRYGVQYQVDLTLSEANG